ncbi:unnamed protein product [Clonostachys byssicola]|uniref:Uncharacterized protein n=1 Tax=Clonostachys byssicola TaxID=160290 RepID=A0A9N9UU41_9HYPO|nr:unnamed protein product [Clonostachys byssicola]
MEEVLNQLEAELEGSPGLLDAAGHIRESCIMVATTVARTMLPNIAYEDLHEDLSKSEVRLGDLLFDLKSTIVVEHRVAIGMIWASAVTRVAYQTRSDRKDYPTGIWVAILVQVVHREAAALGIVELRKIGGATKVRASLC